LEGKDEGVGGLAQHLRQVMRMGDGIARYSGSKFGIILNNCRPEELHAAMERFMRAVRDSVIETRLGPVWALLSIGAVSLPAGGDNAKSAISQAEEALSEAFRLPGDGAVVFSSSEERRARRMLNARCATEIVSCLRDGLFKLAYQPVFEAKSGKIILHEALLRMADTTGTLITAGHLVPIAERLGLIRLIDRAVLQLALQTLEAHTEARLSINISATTVTDPRWNSQLLDMIAAQPEPASRLVVEITETAALDNMETSHDFVRSLRTLQCGVALDDFGAGYTSYRNLKELPLTHIKLDGSFCCNLATGGENHTFVASMVELAHAFGLKVIAEWVETAEDAAILAELGVDGLQGNVLAEASIMTPWQAQQNTGFMPEPDSVAPINVAHFRHEVASIETPRDVPAPREAPRETVVVSPKVEPATLTPVHNVMDLDDATLEAEIAKLDGQPQSTEGMWEESEVLAPLYETALAKGHGAPPQSPPEAPPAELDVTDDLSDNLARLRQALADLSASLGPEVEPLQRAS
jgi:EAL domain-containing protein (putative c-di-GMP-specific phosphodiesterase class I)